MKKAKKHFRSLCTSVILLSAVLLGGCSGGNGPSAPSTAASDYSQQVSVGSTSGKKVVKIASDCSGAPFVWTQSDNSNGAVPISGTSLYANGYDIMIAKKICQENNWELQIEKIGWDGLPTAVISGKADAFIGGVSITKEREKTLDFTHVYYKADLTPIVKKGSKYENAKSLQDLKGCTATSMQNTIWYEKLSQIPGAKIQPGLPDATSVIVAVSSGKADVAVVDKPTAMAAVYTNKNLAMVHLDPQKSFQVTDEDVDLGIPVRKGESDILNGMNKTLDKLAENDRENIMQQAVKIQPINQS